MNKIIQITQRSRLRFLLNLIILRPNREKPPSSHLRSSGVRGRRRRRGRDRGVRVGGKRVVAVDVDHEGSEGFGEVFDGVSGVDTV